MTTSAPDDRTPQRFARDEAIAAEPLLPTPELPADATPRPIEAFLKVGRRPVAVAGVVENGLIRPLDPSIHLPERSRVIIVAAG